MKNPKFVSVVIRCHNAQDRLPMFLREIDHHFNVRFEAYELVIVNDASTDGSSEAIKNLAPMLHGSVTVIELTHFHGVEATMVAGLDRVIGDFVFEFEDTYLNFPLSVLDRMYQNAVAGHDIVAGVPTQLRRSVRMFYSLCNRFSSFEPPLSYERVRLVSRRALDAMLQQRERIRYRQVLYRYTGYRYTRVEYAPLRGNTLKPKTSVRFAMDVIFSFTDAGVRLAHAFVLLFIGAAALTVVLGIIGFVTGVASLSDVLTIGIMSLGFCGVFFLLAVLGEYTARILAEVRSRPIYTLDKTVTWTQTPTESRRAAPEPARGAAQSDREPFMLTQRRESLKNRHAAETSTMSRQGRGAHR